MKNHVNSKPEHTMLASNTATHWHLEDALSFARTSALSAVDQRNDYINSRKSYRVNLADTLREYNAEQFYSRAVVVFEAECDRLFGEVIAPMLASITRDWVHRFLAARRVDMLAMARELCARFGVPECEVGDMIDEYIFANDLDKDDTEIIDCPNLEPRTMTRQDLLDAIDDAHLEWFEAQAALDPDDANSQAALARAQAHYDAALQALEDFNLKD